MNFTRTILAMCILLALSACSRNQPPGVPDQVATPPAAPAPAPAPAPAEPVATTTPVVAPIEAAPPPLDDRIPPYEKTGFPDCDDYVETYRQCLNTRLGGEERKSRAGELKASVRAILGNIARGVDPARVAKQCKRARGLAAKKLVDLGCPF